jgi:choline-phosphate cytidylyltransferase
MMRPSAPLLPRSLRPRSHTFSSEEDNDPLTDDGSPALHAPSSLRHSITAQHQHRGQATLTARSGSPPLRSRLKHTLSPYVVSDDGVDSPTYDGDIESSTTVGRDRDHPSPVQPHSAVTSTLPSPTPHMQDLPAVVTVIPPPSTASSSDPDIEPARVVVHNADASHAFSPSALAPEDIQTFVRCAINGEIHRKYKINEPPTDRPVRIYADGKYLFRFLTRAFLTRPPVLRRVRSFPLWVRPNEFSV